MDEKKVQELWLAFKDGNELGTFQQFKSFMSDPKNRADFHSAFKATAELGNINQFEEYLGVKKKVSSKDSAFDWEAGTVDSSKLFSSQPPAPTVGKKSNIVENAGIQMNWDTGGVSVAPSQYSWSGGETEELFDAPYATSEVSTEVQDSPQTAALKAIRERRGGDYTISAANMAKGDIAIAAKKTPSLLEMGHSFASQLSFSSWIDAEETPRYNPDQRGAAEFNAFSKALSDENREIGLAVKSLESTMKLEYGVDMDDYGGMVAEVNAMRSNANKLVESFNSLPASKRTQEEADRVNAEISKLTEASKPIEQRIDEIQETPEFKEMQSLYELSNINTKKYEDEIKTGKYNNAKRFGDYLQYRQKLKDESYKKMSDFERVANSTGTVILHALAKVPQSIASLTDVIEKSTGLEGGKVGVGDMLQDTLIGLGDDIQAAFPAPTKLQRGGFTDTAMWGDYQVDFTSNGDIQAIRDKDGYIVSAMLSKQQEREIKALKKERRFNSQSFAYQTGSTIADVGIQILGTKGIGGIKALPGVIGGTSRSGFAIGMKPLGNKIGMIATTAGMMSNDLYNEGIENGLSEEDAARYALSTGTLIGVIGTVAGVGIEEQLLLKSKLPSVGLRNKMPGFVGRKAYDVIKGGAGEFTEEVILEKLGQVGVQYAMNEMAGGKFDIQPYKDTTAIINEAATAVVAGGLFSLAKSGGKASKMQRSMLADGAKDIPKTIEMVKEVAAAAGQPLTITEETELRQGLEITQAAVEKIPEEQKTNPDVIETMVEKTKVDDETTAERPVMATQEDVVSNDALRDFNIMGRNFGLDKPSRSDYEEGEAGDKKYAEDNTNHNKSVDNAILGIKEDGILTDSEGNEYIVTQTSQGTRVVNRLADGTEGSDISYRNGKRVSATTPFTKGFTFKPNKQVEQPISPTEPIASEMAQEAVTEAVVQDEGDTSSPSVGQRLRGFYSNSLKKMGGATPGQGLLAKIAKTDPQFYEPMSRSGNAQAVANEIDADGLDTVVQRAMMDNTGEPEGVVAARRIVSLIAIGDAMADANKANDTQALDIMRNQAKELERLLGKKGTEFGQALSMYAIYSQTPEGQLAARLRDVEEKRERTRTRMTEGGRQVGDVVDAIVADVAAEVGITKEEAEKALAGVFGKKKAQEAAKAAIAKGKKEVEEARAAIRNIMLGRANVGLPVAQYAKAGKEFIKLFSGYAKIYKGNIQKIRTAFRKDVNDAGINGTAAYEWLEANHPEITGPITDFHNKMLEAIVGFYNGDIKGDLKTALEKVGLTEQEAIAVSEDFAAQWGAEIARKKASRLKQIVRTHVKSAKKARVIENGLLEAITIGGLNDDVIRRKLEEKYGIKSFTNEQITELNQMVMDMKDMPSRGQKFKQMREMMDYIHLHGGIDITSFIAATWYAKVLFSLKTMLSVTVGNEVNFWDNFVTHGLATEGGLYAMGESFKRLVQPVASRLGIMEKSYQDRGVWFGLAEGWRFIRTGEASREMKKVARSADLELVSRMSFMEAARDAMTSLANISNIFADVRDAGSLKDKMGAAMGVVSQIGTTGYLLAKAFAIPHSRVFKYSLRAISAADSLRYYSMLDFTLDRKAYNSAVAEGLEGQAARARAKEIIGETFRESKAIYDQAAKEFTEYAAQRGKRLDEMFSEVDIAYRAREISEERLDAAWRANMERDASLQGQFDDAVQKVMQSNPGLSRTEAEKVARRIRQRYYDNQLSPTEQARFEAEKVALQNDPQGVMGKLAKLLSADFPAVFDEAINAPEPEPTGDKKVDEFNAARVRTKKGMAKVFKTYSSFMFPFMKTMANVVNMKMERFPVLGGGMKLVDAMAGAPSIDWNNSEQKRVFFARQIAGNIIMLSVLAYIKSMEDDDEPVVTLTGPRDLTKKQGEVENRVWKKETIKVGSKRFYFGDTPYAAVLGFMGVREDALAYAKEGEDDWTMGTMTMALLTQMFTNASYMQTFSNLSTAMQEQDAAKFGAALASPVSGMASSGLQRDLDRWFSPELRDRASIENRFVGEMLSRTPFAANYLLDFRYNSIGEAINPYENESFFTQAIGLDKYISSTEVSNPIFEVLADKNVRFKGIGKNISVLGTDATYQEKRDYTLFVGRYRNKVLSANLQAMREMSPEQLEMQLDKTDSEAKRAAELFILLQRKDKSKPDEGQISDVSVSAIDRFINEYDPEMVKQDSKLFMEELRTEKPEAEVDKDLFF